MPIFHVQGYIQDSVGYDRGAIKPSKSFGVFLHNPAYGRRTANTVDLLYEDMRAQIVLLYDGCRTGLGIGKSISGLIVADRMRQRNDDRWHAPRRNLKYGRSRS